MSDAYYNENDPFCAQWLRNLIIARRIAPGEVDERSVVDVRGDDLRGFTQCHFFAGIGVWSYALQQACWLDDRSVWTGSCPCQSFSAAGSRKGFRDERHLWPHWSRLIGERRPDVIFGEQVASRDGLAWLDFICADLEAADYAVGTVDTCAAGFGAPYTGNRLYFAATRCVNGNSRSGKTNEMEAMASHNAQRHSWWAVEPEMGRVAYGAPARMGRLRAYGNAIVAPQAEAFIRAYMECKP